jgi:alkylation response protein AidB-like acyl-CoA dehydrogenase
MKQLGRDGWAGVAWPKEYGGRGESVVRQWLFLEELDYRRLPTGDLSMLSVGPTLIRVGSAEQKRRYLPAMLRGEVHFAGGYTEPSAGTDLAALRTRAVAHADGSYRINGQKVFTTGAHYASHIWLATRTGPQEARHKAITMFIVPMDAPGITVRALETQPGWRTNEVFLEDVFVPAADRVGDENEGWAIITQALDLERLTPYSRVARDLDDLVGFLHRYLDPARFSIARGALVELHAEVEVLRLIAQSTAAMIDSGVGPLAGASMFKALRGNVRQRIAFAAMELIGPDAVVRRGQPEAVFAGWAERAYRASPLSRFAGGTEEIQLDIVAQRELGLPRSR